LWAGVVAMILAVGMPFSRRYGPEVKEIRQSDYTMEMVLALAESDGPLHLYFRRPGELDPAQRTPGTAFVTFFSPRQKIPEKVAANHYRFPMQEGGVSGSIIAILALIQEEFDGREVQIHLGWPLSSWLDRMGTGVFVANLVRLPRLFPQFRFSIEYATRVGRAAKAAR
jgi:hypothetical protein